MAEPTVTVNGIPVDVINRSFELANFLLQPGLNNIRIQASDALGNSKLVQRNINYLSNAGQRLKILHGHKGKHNIANVVLHSFWLLYLKGCVMSFHKKKLYTLMIILVFLMSGCVGAAPTETTVLFEDAELGVDLHIEKIKSIENNGNTYILYKKSKWESKDSSYVILRLGADGGIKSIDMKDLFGLKDIQLGNISFTQDNNLVLSFMINGEIKLFLFRTDFESFETHIVMRDDSVDRAYYFDKSIYTISSVRNTIEIIKYNYIFGNSIDTKSKKVIQVDSALRIDDALFVNGENFYLLADFVSDKSIEKKVVVIEQDKISYIDVDDKAVEIMGIDKSKKLLYLSVLDGTKRRVKNYSALEINILARKIVNKYRGVSGLRWAGIRLYDGKEIVSLEVEKNKWTKKIKLYCNDMVNNKREQLVIDTKGLLRFYGEAFILSGTGENTILAFIYSELKDRVTYDVLSIVEIKKELCNSR